MSRFFRDFVVTIRSLSRAPAIAVSAIASLALGITVTGVIASAIDRVLLQPLPFRDPSRLVSVYRTGPQSDSWPFSASGYRFLSTRTRELSSFAVLRAGTAIAS